MKRIICSILAICILCISLAIPVHADTAEVSEEEIQEIDAMVKDGFKLATFLLAPNEYNDIVRGKEDALAYYNYDQWVQKGYFLANPEQVSCYVDPEIFENHGHSYYRYTLPDNMQTKEAWLDVYQEYFYGDVSYMLEQLQECEGKLYFYDYVGAMSPKGFEYPGDSSYLDSYTVDGNVLTLNYLPVSDGDDTAYYHPPITCSVHLVKTADGYRIHSWDGQSTFHPNSAEDLDSFNLPQAGDPTVTYLAIAVVATISLAVLMFKRRREV